MRLYKKATSLEAVWPDGYNIIQYLAIYNNENFPRSLKMPKLVQKFAKFSISYPKNCPKTSTHFAKGEKFRQIWSHWTIIRQREPWSSLLSCVL